MSGRAACGRELALVLVLGVGLRALLFAQTDGVWSDSVRHVPTAYNLAHGRWAVAETELGRGLHVDRLYPPGYPAALALVDVAARDLVRAGQLVSLLAGVGALALAFAVGRRVDGAAAGVCAALLSATSVPLISYSAMVMAESLVTFLALGAAWLFVRARRPRALVACSLTLALAFLTKPAALALAGPLALAAAVAPGGRRGARLLWLLLPLALVVACEVALERYTIDRCGLAHNGVMAFMDALRLRGDPAFTGWEEVRRFSVAAWIVDHPTRYAGYAAESYRVGLVASLRHAPAPLAVICVVGWLVRWRRTGSAGQGRRLLLLGLVLALPLIPALVIVHPRFMARMVLPSAPLVHLLLAGGVLDLVRAVGRPLVRRRAVSPAASIGLALALLAPVGHLLIPVVDRLVPDFEGHKRVWRAAARWLNDHAVTPRVLDDGGDGGEYLGAYLLRERTQLEGLEAIVERVQAHRPTDPPQYLLLMRPQLMEQVARLREREAEWHHVVRVATFGGPTYACEVLRLGGP